MYTKLFILHVKLDSICLFKANEDIVNKKVEKPDVTSKTDKSNIQVIADKSETTAKIEDFTKQADGQEKKEPVKEPDNKTEKNEKNQKVDQVEPIKKEVKEEKKNSSEKVDKTVKNEKNVKAAKETAKPSPANGTKVLTSPDKPKVGLESWMLTIRVHSFIVHFTITCTKSVRIHL